MTRNNYRKSNITIALDVLRAKNEKIHPAYFSKDISRHEQQLFVLMIPKRERWYSLAVKELLALLR